MRIGRLNLEIPVVMGILNITPDSFSDGGRFLARDDALGQAEAMLQSGASIIDVGGESTRPGAQQVSAAEEIERVVPIIEAIHNMTDAPVSIDTSKADVMRAAVEAGAAMVNDVRALREAGAVAAAADLGVVVCLMHMQGNPRTMQEEPHYEDVTLDVRDFLASRIETCIDAGIDRERMVIDPGFGFGKSYRHNVELLMNLRQLTDLGQPLMVGLSRKSMLGEMTGRDTGDRIPASIAAAVIAVQAGADILRVHDVAETVEALKVTQAIAKARQS
ncbi:MAG: dihydropteroate synthase [Proteobacteria bacterium]|nr:dihydropteroate synthase [Pseudomonadota bacterium]MCH7980580.1 dihydropteroate synthase [Pseudomonadota bacterium]